MKKAIIILAVLFRTCSPSFAQTYIGGGLSVGFGQEQFTQRGKIFYKTTPQVFAFSMFGGYQRKHILFEGSGLYDGSFRGSGNIGYKFVLMGRNSFELLPGAAVVDYFGQSPVKLTGMITGRLMFRHFALTGSYYTDKVFYIGIGVKAFTKE